MNDVPFTETFKTAIREAVNPHSSVTFGDIPESEWSIPEWINTTKMEEGMASMKRAGVVYGDSLSYRHMCRYNSGFFFRHPLVMQYDYYWRVGAGRMQADLSTFYRVRCSEVFARVLEPATVHCDPRARHLTKYLSGAPSMVLW